MMEAIVLAGGLGTRLRNVAPGLPKPMAPVAGRPFLTYLLDYLAAQCITRTILSVGYRHEAITSFFGTRYGSIELEYCIEHELLGTGGGLCRAATLIQGDSFFALNGDTLLRLDYHALEALARNVGSRNIVVALRSLPDAARYGSVTLEAGRITGFNAKGTPGPGLINGGVYWMPKHIFDSFSMPPKFSLEQDFLESRLDELQPAGLVTDAPFVAIGLPESLEQAQILLPQWSKFPPGSNH